MIMANWPCRRRRRVGLCVSVLGVVLQISGTRSAPIAWSKQGAFEACLEASLEKWLQAQAALVVNEDPAAGRLDDAVVAKWTVDILSLCRMQAGTGNPAYFRCGQYGQKARRSGLAVRFVGILRMQTDTWRAAPR